MTFNKINKFIATTFAVNIFFWGLTSFVFAQTKTISKTINQNTIALNDSIFQFNALPIEQNTLNIEKYTTSVKINNPDFVYSPVSPYDSIILSKLNIPKKISVNVNTAINRKKQIIYYSFVPFRFNIEKNIYEKVVSYSFIFKFTYDTHKSKGSLHTYAANSLLSSGDWYKIRIDTTGIFKLTYDQLKQIGLSSPEKVRAYSYGGKQLPMDNSESNYDDMVEIPLKFFKGDDNVFNSGDYIIFYGQHPVTWRYDAGKDMFLQQIHDYAKSSYVFLTDGQSGESKIINIIDNTSINPNYTTSTYDSYKYHEINKYNLIKSGRIWYGEKFKSGNKISLQFAFPQIVSSSNMRIFVYVAGRKQFRYQTCYFNFSYNNNNIGKINIADNYSKYVHANAYSKYFDISNPSSSLNLNIEFSGVSTDMEGYLNYVCINARENIKLLSSQLMFRDKKTAQQGRAAKFIIDNSGKNIFVWNITDATNPYEIKITSQNNVSYFTDSTNTINQYIVFDGINYFTPVISGTGLGHIENQNLHGIRHCDMIIVTNPKFQAQTEELAKFHKNNDTLSVFITQPEKIYNEFSSGMPDVSAIRNFMRMLYDKANSNAQIPKYLLLFGDGSYDNRETNKNSNYILTYQSTASLSETASYVADDFFVLLDIGEGELSGSKDLYGYLDMGVGRFPVRTVEEAQLMIAKIKQYSSPESYGAWKNRICFIGDDEDSMKHQKDADDLCSYIIVPQHPELNINKIYLDSYKQFSTPSGQRYPDVTTAINEQVKQGALFIDYVGHGNPRILAHEQILSVPDVLSWTNWDKLSIFMTASCEVGRFDDYDRTSLGETFIMNPKGAGVAAVTTTRVVYSGANSALSTQFFKVAFNKNLRLGDIMKIAKNKMSPSGINHRNFTLLGDPALKMAIPENKIKVGNINNNFIKISESNNNKNLIYTQGDTVGALSKVKIEGYIDDKYDNALNKDGILFITIYDKTDTILMIANDNSAQKMKYTIQRNILYKGKASITKGYFSFEFIIPKDINYKYGKGKISLYAAFDSTEATGYSTDIIIGGSSENADIEYDGPKIKLYMNDTLFVNGGITDENPVLLAKISDESGINTTGIGFGHNITATLDGNQDKVFILNDYYENYIDVYNKGELNFQLKDLSEGYHYITLKAWDIYNNSSEAVIEFYVFNGESPVMDKMYNTPNPFSDKTWFTFEHNQPAGISKVTIKIYDVMGNKVSELNNKNTTDGYSIEPISWDGTNYGGAKLPNGVYIYKTEITSVDGQKTYKSSKLMIFR